MQRMQDYRSLPIRWQQITLRLLDLINGELLKVIRQGNLSQIFGLMIM